jgi:hypothetical protein
MVLDAREARIRQIEKQTVPDVPQDICDESSSDGQKATRTTQSEWFVSAGTGKSATAAA